MSRNACNNQISSSIFPMSLTFKCKPNLLIYIIRAKVCKASLLSVFLAVSDAEVVD